MPILPGTSSTPDVPRTLSLSSFLTSAPLERVNQVAVSLQLLDERALGEGEPGLVGPVDVAAEPVLQVLLDEAEAVADAVSLEELVPVVHVPRRVRRHVLGPRAHN